MQHAQFDWPSKQLGGDLERKPGREALGTSAPPLSDWNKSFGGHEFARAEEPLTKLTTKFPSPTPLPLQAPLSHSRSTLTPRKLGSNSKALDALQPAGRGLNETQSGLFLFQGRGEAVRRFPRQRHQRIELATGNRLQHTCPPTPKKE